MNIQAIIQTTLDNALQAHQAGHVMAALPLYEQCLQHDPQNPLALYGVAAITLSGGDIRGYDFGVRALTNERISTLEKPLAAQSLVHNLLQQQYQDHARALLDVCEKQGIIVPDAGALRQAVTIPEYLKAKRYDHLLDRELERYRPIESTQYVYAIDIVGGCNLRCPTCPVSQESGLPKGIMKLDLYQKILTKIVAESPDMQPDIWLFNWTEPMLHPQVDAFIEATHAQGMTTFLSTNLNIGHRIEAVMRAMPTRLKVSLSSLDQAIYSKTHTRGDIAQVVENMRTLARWRDHYRSTTQIWIGHHLYRNTLQDQPAIKALADELGFGYAPSPAIVAPLERVMKMQQHPEQDDVDGLRSQLLYDPLAIQSNMAHRRSGRKDCELRFNMMTIQHEGVVNLCCASTQPLANKNVHFLEYSHEELEAMKYQQSFCQKCMQSNLHLTVSDC